MFSVCERAMMAYGRTQLHSFLTSALDVGDWSALPPSRFMPKEKVPPPPHCIRVAGFVFFGEQTIYFLVPGVEPSRAELTVVLSLRN